ncbi:MAG: hypothetical protein H7Y30_16935 [Pyrinomonadaceae bacterium]|nr:hypothetical protein [Pyrinomonadaceae bacterium]
MKYILTLLGGLILGAALVYFFFVGAPRANPLPGSPIKPPDQGGPPPGTAIVTLDERFFDAVLGAIFRDMSAPSFPLKLTSMNGQTEEGQSPFRFAAFQGGCQDKVTLTPEGSGMKTGVRFTGGKVMAPLAFNGSYNVLGSCVQFKGWAQANMQLAYDQSKQIVYGQINVEGVNLEGTPPVVSGIITPLVQGTINQRVNPLEILRAAQLALAVPVQASNGTLNARVIDVRAEVAEGMLRLHVTYDFKGGGQAQPQQPQG